MSLHELLHPLVTEYEVTESEVAALTAAARTTLYLRGGELPAQLRAAPYTPVIERGSLRVGQVSSQGRQAITDIWQAGCRFWRFSPDAAPAPTATIAARVDGTIVHLLPFEQVLALAARHPAMARAVAASAAAEAATSRERLAWSSLYPLQARLGRTLVWLAAGQPSITGTTHEELAALLGTSRDRVCKALAGLAAAGLVSLSHYGRQIDLRDPSRLAALEEDVSIIRTPSQA